MFCVQLYFYCLIFVSHVLFLIILFLITHYLMTGRNYDWNGKRKLTWNKEMAEAYDNRAKCFVDQYFNYEVTENVKVGIAS